MRAGSGLCAGQESVLNAVPEGGSAAGLTATIGPWTMVRWVPGGPGPCLNFLSASKLNVPLRDFSIFSAPNIRSRSFQASAPSPKGFNPHSYHYNYPY